MSKLEDRLAFALQAVASDVNGRWRFPQPVREFRFDRCCQCPGNDHLKSFGGVCVRCHADGVADYAHRFEAGRRWRFDFAWPALRVAVECDGGTFTGGRHVRGVGFEKDAEKLNVAAIQGWLVLRFTQRQVTSGEALNLIERALQERAQEAVV